MKFNTDPNQVKRSLASMSEEERNIYLARLAEATEMIMPSDCLFTILLVNRDGSRISHTGTLDARTSVGMFMDAYIKSIREVN